MRARAVLREELPGQLSQSGIPDELVTELTALLEALDAVRFTGQSGAHAAGELTSRAAKVVRQLATLGKARRKKGGGR